MLPTREDISTAFRIQAQWCERLGSPLYGQLLEQAAADVDDGGPFARWMEGWEGRPIQDALVLRAMGAVHRLVLNGEAPQLAAHYPSTGGEPRWPAVWEALRALVESRMDELRAALGERVQTNEVNRSAPLLGGFLEIAAKYGKTMRLLEIGASAGLNLLWDRYRYELGEHRWGDQRSPVVIRAEWQGPPPRLDAPVGVVERCGLDLSPVDVRDDASVRRLESFVWPDQLERLEQLRAAVRLARQSRPRLETGSAATWVRRQLNATVLRTVTVVYHSILWWYLSEDEQREFTAVLEEAGARATAEAPLAWLNFEVRNGKGAELRLRTWPGGEERVLGYGDPHGRQVKWLER